MSRTRVAVVATTAETILEDTLRALGLVDGGRRDPGQGLCLAAAAPSPGLPGGATKPWQLAGWNRWRQQHGLGEVERVVRVSPDTGAASRQLGWLSNAGVRVLDCEAGKGALAEASTPILGMTWGAAPRLASWDATRAVGLASLVGSRTWGVRGATALFCDAQRARRSWPPRVSWPDAMAEAMRLHRESFDHQFCLLDATVCGSDSRRRRPMVLDLVLAGRDPVAVDAVGALLLGWQPRSIPWLSRLDEEGLGTCDLAQIECVGGGVELSNAVARARTWRAPRGRGLGRAAANPAVQRVGEWSAHAYHALLWKPWVGRPIRRLYRECPWGRLEARFREARGAAV